MPGMPWPQNGKVSAALWNRCTLGEWLLPGTVEVTVSGGIEVDKGKAGDKHGANVKIKGAKPRSVKIRWRIWQEKPGELADWELMQTIVEALEAPEGKKDTPPLVIFHPATFTRQIDNIIIEDIDGPNWDPAKGFMEMNFDATEVNPPAASAKGIGKAGPAKTTKGSDWEQTPNYQQIYVDEDGNQVAVKAGAPLPPGVHIETRTVDGETVAQKSAPHHTATGP